MIAAFREIYFLQLRRTPVKHLHAALKERRKTIYLSRFRFFILVLKSCTFKYAKWNTNYSRMKLLSPFNVCNNKKMKFPVWQDSQPVMIDSHVSVVLKTGSGQCAGRKNQGHWCVCSPNTDNSLKRCTRGRYEWMSWVSFSFTFPAGKQQILKKLELLLCICSLY